MKNNDMEKRRSSVAIGHDGGKSTGIEIVFEVRRMNGDGTVASGAAAYALPLAVVPGESDKWEAGKHYNCP